MGLFGGLFNKKVCCACGGEIGMLGNRKLEDGNLCKRCAGKLSPWFSERRHSTVDQILEQLRYRDENHRLIPSFRPTREYGYHTKVYIDDNMQAFMVTSSRDWMADNPDIIGYNALIECVADIHEDRREVFRHLPDGKTESFHPRRYDYDYDFHILMRVNSPWFDDIRFALKTNVHDDDRRTLEECIVMAEDIVETMNGTRPDLSVYVPYHPPFCHRCGRELAEGMVCHCDRVPQRPPMPAPMAAPHAAPTPAPHTAPMPGAPGRPAAPAPHQPPVQPGHPGTGVPASHPQRPGRPEQRADQRHDAPAQPARHTEEKPLNAGRPAPGAPGAPGQLPAERQGGPAQRGQAPGTDPHAPKGPAPRRG